MQTHQSGLTTPIASSGTMPDSQVPVLYVHWQLEIAILWCVYGNKIWILYNFQHRCKRKFKFIKCVISWWVLLKFSLMHCSMWVQHSSSGANHTTCQWIICCPWACHYMPFTLKCLITSKRNWAPGMHGGIEESLVAARCATCEEAHVIHSVDKFVRF